MAASWDAMGWDESDEMVHGWRSHIDRMIDCASRYRTGRCGTGRLDRCCGICRVVMYV
jgi:hypothetical protein